MTIAQIMEKMIAFSEGNITSSMHPKADTAGRRFEPLWNIR